MVTWASRGTLWELFWPLAGALGVSGGSSGDPWASLGGPWELPGRIGGGPGCPGRVPGGPWVSRGVLEGLWGMLGLSGALLGGLGDPQSDPRSVFKHSRQDEKSLKNIVFYYIFSNWADLGNHWRSLEALGWFSGGLWSASGGPSSAQGGHSRVIVSQGESPRRWQGGQGGRQSIRGRPRGGLGLTFFTFPLVRRSRRRPAEG